jgi:hypothetical protein
MIALAVAGNLVGSCHLPLRIPLEDYGAMETTSPEKGSSRVVVLVAIVGLVSTITASALSGIFTTLGVHDQFEQQRLAQSQDLRRGVYEEYLASTTQSCIVFLFAGSSDAQKNSAVKKLEDAHARALLVSKEDLREPLDNFNDYMYQVANQGNDCEAQYEKLRDEFIDAAKADLETG